MNIIKTHYEDLFYILSYKIHINFGYAQNSDVIISVHLDSKVFLKYFLFTLLNKMQLLCCFLHI